MTTIDQPTQTQASNVSSEVVSSSPCVLRYLSVTNGNAAARWFAVFDASALPVAAARQAALWFGPVAPNATCTCDSSILGPNGALFANGCIVASVLGPPSGQNVAVVTLGAADMTLNAWVQ